MELYNPIAVAPIRKRGRPMLPPEQRKKRAPRKQFNKNLVQDMRYPINPPNLDIAFAITDATTPATYAKFAKQHGFDIKYVMLMRKYINKGIWNGKRLQIPVREVIEIHGDTEILPMPEPNAISSALIDPPPDATTCDKIFRNIDLYGSVWRYSLAVKYPLDQILHIVRYRQTGIWKNRVAGNRPAAADANIVGRLLEDNNQPIVVPRPLPEWNPGELR